MNSLKSPVMPLVTSLLVVASIWNISATTANKSHLSLAKLLQNDEDTTYITAKNIKTDSQYSVSQLASVGGTLD